MVPTASTPICPLLFSYCWPCFLFPPFPYNFRGWLVSSGACLLLLISRQLHFFLRFLLCMPTIIDLPFSLHPIAFWLCMPTIIDCFGSLLLSWILTTIDHMSFFLGESFFDFLCHSCFTPFYLFSAPGGVLDSCNFRLQSMGSCIISKRGLHAFGVLWVKHAWHASTVAQLYLWLPAFLF